METWVNYGVAIMVCLFSGLALTWIGKEIVIPIRDKLLALFDRGIKFLDKLEEHVTRQTHCLDHLAERQEEQGRKLDSLLQILDRRKTRRTDEPGGGTACQPGS